jgi:hypothetical protein
MLTDSCFVNLFADDQFTQMNEMLHLYFTEMLPRAFARIVYCGQAAVWGAAGQQVKS